MQKLGYEVQIRETAFNETKIRIMTMSTFDVLIQTR
jgi:hypothetical protein